MASGYPCDARLEGIEQRRFPLPFRFLDAHAERRAHHEPLELRLHDPVCAARTRQAQLVATLCAHALPARFISSTTRTVGIITGEYKVAEADEGIYRLPDTADGVRPQRLDRLFECLEGVVRTCPECSKKKLPLGALIVHLNDAHHWTRDRIDFAHVREKFVAEPLSGARAFDETGDIHELNGRGNDA